MGNNKMDWLVEVETEEEVRSFQPDFENIYALGIRGLIVTARANAEFDFVSRFFAPQSGVPEDPVTGSAHCCLAPYWSDKLGKTKMTGYQASQRGGIVGVEIQGDRVLLRGYATTILEGNLRC
jgi:predicted PhzF superfamily epimerase YddE/YHI9